MGNNPGDSLLYPVIKMMIGVVCLILAIEYGYSFIIYQAASFGIFYIGDLAIWLSAGFILFTEGLQQYIEILRKPRLTTPREIVTH